jgi:hypothetical protein
VIGRGAALGLCDSAYMKALKSPLAKKLLADPVSKAQLRSFLVGSAGPDHAKRIVIEVPGEPGLRVSPRIVGKAS